MIYAIFAVHWIASVFFQSFFQHRYAAHRMYTMTPRTERTLHLLTYLVQGWVLGSEGFSPANSTVTLVGYVLILAWIIWLAVFALRMQESTAGPAGRRPAAEPEA